MNNLFNSSLIASWMPQNKYLIFFLRFHHQTSHFIIIIKVVFRKVTSFHTWWFDKCTIFWRAFKISFTIHTSKKKIVMIQQPTRESIKHFTSSYLPSFLPNGSSYWTPIHHPAANSVVPANLTTPFLAGTPDLVTKQRELMVMAFAFSSSFRNASSFLSCSNGSLSPKRPSLLCFLNANTESEKVVETGMSWAD